MRSGMVSCPDWSGSIEDMVGLGLVPGCCLVSYNRIYQRLSKVRSHLRRWSMTRLHRQHIVKMEILSRTSRIWTQYLQQDLCKAYQAAQFKFDECSPWVRIQDLGTQRDPQGLLWSDIERQCSGIADIPCMIHFGACYSSTLGRFLTRMEMALDAAQVDTPSSASFPKQKVIAACSYPAVCSELGMDDKVHEEGSALWPNVPNNSMDQLFHCQHCTTRLYRCRRRRNIHERSCGQHYEPHENSDKVGAGPEGGIPAVACEHITCFCSNGLRIIPRIDGHQCSDCGETVDTDVPPCECCCHTEECRCCFFCRSIPCHCPQTSSLAMAGVGI